MLSQNRFNEHLEPGACWTGNHTFAFQISDAIDSAIRTGNEQCNIGSHGGDGTDVILLGPSPFAANGKVRDSCIGKGQFQLILLQPTNIFLRSFGAFGLDLPVNGILVIIHDFRDRSTNHRKSPTHRCRPHADELPLGRFFFTATDTNGNKNQ